MPVTLTIDGQRVTVKDGSTVLQAAKAAGIRIPTLCYMEGINEIGACRLCMVEVKGQRALQAACVFPAAEGMEVYTNSPAARAARRTNLELLLSNHPQECLTCSRNGHCELQNLAQEMGVRDIRFAGAKSVFEPDNSTPSIVRDPNKCVLCRRCLAVCHKIQGVGVLGPVGRGFNTTISPEAGHDLRDVACVLCGQCVSVCPTGALSEVDSTDRVFAALSDKDKYVVVQTAPAVRVAIGEEFDLKPGTVTTGQMVTALKRLGFKAVFDTDFTADLTIWEEANELVERIKHNGVLPMITSCSPGWIKYIEHYYPDLLGHLSTCKSPQQMFGAVAKSYYAEKIGVKPEDMIVVSIMPCTAKKFEAGRPEMSANGIPDVDIAITTREAARMMKRAGIDLSRLPESNYDAPLGISTGAAVIFGTTGGVMEAALRTAYEWVTGQELKNIELTSVRGLKGVKQAQVELPGTGLTVKVAVAHTLKNARVLLEAIKHGTADYQFIEIMACPGGCIGGGGQPRPHDISQFWEVREQRRRALYRIDRRLPMRKSHDNPAVKELYHTFLGEVGGEKAHHLLHTHYTERGKYPRTTRRNDMKESEAATR
jgi:NADH-quinone oxidoreductase subunit G/NADP-reducing hydrogenase subunit HndD